MGIPLLLAIAIPSRFFSMLFGQGTANENILVIKISALGDGVVLIPALQHLRSNFGKSKIYFLGGPSNQKLIENLALVNEFISFNNQGIRKILKMKFRLVIDFEQWMRATAIFTAFLRANTKIGFKSKDQCRHWAFTHKIKFDTSRHTGENFWNLTQAALKMRKIIHHLNFSQVCQAAGGNLEIFKKRDFLQVPKDLMPPLLVLHPGCGDHGEFREWPIENWKELIVVLKSKYPKAKIVVTGQGRYEELLARALEEVGARSLVNSLSFEGFMGVLQSATWIFSGNTGAMHLASFLNKNLTVLNGPSDLKMWGPLWGGKVIASPLECAPCLTWGSDYGCSDPVCVKAISLQQVINSMGLH